LWHRIEARVVMLSACIGRSWGALSPTGRLFKNSWMASNDLQIINAVLHHFWTHSVLSYVHLCNYCCEFGLCQWATTAYCETYHSM